MKSKLILTDIIIKNILIYSCIKKKDIYLISEETKYVIKL